MKEKTVFVEDMKINYKIAGSGPAILVLHGWGSSSDSWIEVQNALVKKGYLVICPDLPGFGKSDLPKHPFSVADYQKVVVEFVKKIFSEESFDLFLLGHSFGGRISIKITAENSLDVKKLILCDPAGVRVNPSFKTKIIIFFASLGDLFFSLEPLKRIKHLARNIFYSFIKKRDYAKSTGVMKETIKKILKQDLTLELSDIRTETLLLWGEKDRIVPLKYSKVYNEKIKDSILEVFSEVGHSPHLECPSLLVEKVLNFLNKK
jgi:pimeloyl-ACP methyl ester carboxylesterase